MYNSIEIADAFNTQNDKRHWRAKALCHREHGAAPDLVQFDSNSIVQLHLNCSTGLWTVQFNKLQCAWGDYVQAIRRSLYAVLNTLACAALPFEAPIDLETMAVTVIVHPNGDTLVSWHLLGVPDAPAGLDAEQTAEYQKNFPAV